MWQWCESRLVCCFFFQAEAGIRDVAVTGVQTCALPIWEVVWCDDAGVTCRRWNWRQGPRTALSESTTRAIFILDALDAVTDDDLTTAAEELSSILGKLNPDVRTEKRLIKAGGAQ